MSSVSNGTDRDYGHVLREWSCAFCKAEYGAFAERQSKRTCLGKCAYVAFGGACRLFDFHRVEDAIMLNKNVYFRTGFVAVEPKSSLPASVPVAFEKFSDDIRFKHRSAHRAVRQRFRRCPAGKVAAQTCVGEIELRSLDNAGRDVAGIRAKQIDKAGCAEDSKPVAGSRRGDANVACKLGNVEKLPCPRRSGLEEYEKAFFVRDACKVVEVPFQIGADVRAEERLPISRFAGDECRERAAVDAGENGRKSVEGRLGVNGVGNEECIVVNPAEFFSLGDAAKVDDADSPGKRFAYVLHQMELLGTSEPELPASIAFVVDHNLDKRQELRGVLDFVNDDWRRVGLKKKCGIGSCKSANVGIVKRHESAAILGGISQKRRFADLPCATKHNGGKLSRQFPNSGRSGSFYKFHADIISYYNSICNWLLGKLTVSPSICPVFVLLCDANGNV